MKKAWGIVGLGLLAWLATFLVLAFGSTSGTEKLSLFGSGIPLEVFPSGGMAFSVGVWDINRDKVPDLVVLDPFASRIALLRGTGRVEPKASNISERIFGSPRVVENQNLAGARAFDLLDFDRDGRMDLIFAGEKGLFVLLGEAYTKAVPLSVEPKASNIKIPSPVAVLVADLNRDGVSDLIVASNDQGVYILTGRTRGERFSAPVRVPLHGVPERIVVGDLNGDGRLDLAALVRSRNETFLTVLPGDGTGGLREAGSFSLSIPNDSVELGAGDLNSDGLTDLVTASAEKQSLIVMLGSREGAWTLADFASPFLASPRGMALGDFNLDGDIDIAVTSAGEEEDRLVTARNDGSGRFTILPGEVFPLGSHGKVPAGYVPLMGADLDRDGDLDLVTATDRENVILMQNNIRS